MESNDYEGIELRDFAVEHAERHRPKEEARPTESEWSLFKRFWTSHIRITIEEAASRDHLALERTFLAYMRTASAVAQFGVTLAQLFRLNVDSANAITPTALKIGKGLGATVEVIAIVFCLLGAAYFAKQQMGLMKGVTVSRGYEIWIMVFVIFALFVIILALLVAASNW